MVFAFHFGRSFLVNPRKRKYIREIRSSVDHHQQQICMKLARCTVGNERQRQHSWWLFCDLSGLCMHLLAQRGVPFAHSFRPDTVTLASRLVAHCLRRLRSTLEYTAQDAHCVPTSCLHAFFDLGLRLSKAQMHADMYGQ